MGEVKHTPGPWTIGRCDWEYANVEFSGSGSFFTIMATGRECPTAFAPEVDDGDARANAQLIAAAPALLAALEELCAEDGNAILGMAMALSALAAAKGERV